MPRLGKYLFLHLFQEYTSENRANKLNKLSQWLLSKCMPTRQAADGSWKGPLRSQSPDSPFWRPRPKPKVYNLCAVQSLTLFSSKPRSFFDPCPRVLAPMIEVGGSFRNRFQFQQHKCGFGATFCGRLTWQGLTFGYLLKLPKGVCYDSSLCKRNAACQSEEALS